MNLLLGILVPLIRRLAVGTVLGRIGSMLSGPIRPRNGPADPSANAIDTPVVPDAAQSLPPPAKEERH